MSNPPLDPPWQPARRCLRCRSEVRKDESYCSGCGERWDVSADVLPTQAQLYRWAALYWTDPEIAKTNYNLGPCFAQDIAAIADLIERELLSPHVP